MTGTRALLLYLCVTVVVCSLFVDSGEYINDTRNITKCEPKMCVKLKENSHLCTVTPYRYTYCENSNCTANFTCTDGTTPIKAFTTPELISKTVSYPLTMWAQIISFFGILCLFFMRNKQPMRTKNIYMIAGMVIAQLIHVRFTLNQTFYDTCFLSNAIAVTLLGSEKWIILAQLHLNNLHLQKERKLATITKSLITHSDIEESADTKPFKHFLNSALGGMIVLITPLIIHSVIIHFYTDIGITEIAPCNLKDGYPGQGEIGFTSGITIITTNIVYLLQNYGVMSVIMFQLEFWLIITNTFVLLAMWFATFVVLKVVASSDPWFTTNFAYISFVVLLATNVVIECGLPLLYYLIRHKPRSVVTEDLRAKFALCQKQASAMEKLVNHASTELETESILLYQTIRTLRNNRANVLSSNFQSSQRLASLIFDKYIQGEYKTLKWYDLRHITNTIQTPIELLEKESVLEELENAVREKIVLPMYARMLAKQKPSY